MRSNKARGGAYALICVAIWALLPVVSRNGQQSLDHYQFLFWSSLLSTLTMALLCLMRGTLVSLKQYRVVDWGWATGLGFLGCFLYYLLLYQGYAGGKSMEVLIVQYTWPIFIALLSPLLLKERFEQRTQLAVALGFVAVALVLSKGRLMGFSVEQPTLLLWVAVGALSFALFSVLSKKVTLEPTSLILVYFAVATLASLGSMLGFSAPVWPSPDSWWPLLANGVLVNGLSYVLWLKALRTADASFIAPFTFIAPVLSTLYLQLFFDEPFLPVYGVGIALVVLAGLLNSGAGKPRTG